MASIASWIYDKPLRGNYTFTHDEVAQAFPEMSVGAVCPVSYPGGRLSSLQGWHKFEQRLGFYQSVQ